MDTEDDTTVGRSIVRSREVRCARVYDEAEPEDGTRVLVDRLWPRGVRKDTPGLDAWVKEAAPSAELRTWYGHAPERFAEFRERYRHELAGDGGPEAVDRLRALAGGGTLTLLTATREIDLSHVQVLAEILRVPEDASAAEGGGGGGEAVCWLPRVCPECGRLSEARPPATCERCGAEIPTG